MLLVNNKLNTTKSLISRALIVSYINHDEFVLENNLLREFDEIKEKIKNSQNAVEYPVVKEKSWTKMLVLEKINKID